MGRARTTVVLAGLMLLGGAFPAVAGHTRTPGTVPVPHGQTLRYTDVFVSEGLCGVDVGGFFSQESKEVLEVTRNGSTTVIIRSTTFTNLRTGESIRLSGQQTARMTRAELCQIIGPLGL